MTVADRQQIAWLCLGLCHDFAHYIDNGLYDEVSELFTSDGLFDRNGQRLVGRSAISAALHLRPATQFTRHLVSNFRATSITADVVEASHYNFTLISQRDADGAPRFKDPPGVLIDMRDRFERTADGWKIATRIARRAIFPEGMAYVPA